MRIPGSEKTWLKIDGVLIIAFFITIALLTGWCNSAEVSWTGRVPYGPDSAHYYVYDQLDDGALYKNGQVVASDTGDTTYEILLDNSSDYNISVTYYWYGDPTIRSSESFFAKYVGGVTNMSSADLEAIGDEVLATAVANPENFVGSAGSGSVKCSVWVAAPLGTNIHGAKVSVFDTSGGSTIATDYTTNGLAVLSLDPGTWVFRTTKTGGYTWADSTWAFTTDLNDTVVGTVFSPSTPSAANTCMCDFYLYDMHGDAIYGQGVTITLPNDVRDTCSDVTLGGKPDFRRTDADGHFEVPLLYSSCLSDGSGDTIKYIMTLEGDTKKKYQFSVPDTDSYRLVF